MQETICRKDWWNAMEYRIEKDTMGEVKVPAGRLYGAQTQRAVENFPVSGLTLQPAFVRAQAIIKLAAAKANMEADRLDAAVGAAIVKAAEEVAAGRHDAEFVVDVFQAGAGTSQNMNINEVLAARAKQILEAKGDSGIEVHPNDHPNMAQSTNDTIHAAIHIAAAVEIKEKLLPAAAGLELALRDKQEEFDDVIKTGRTHLQDAVPMRLGQEFGAWATMMKKNRARLESALDALLELCIGGTAVGSGLNTDPHYRRRVVAHINDTTGLQFREAEDLFEAMQGFDAVVEAAGALRTLTTSLKKIADDLRLLSSGPRTGLAEIMLPPVQPGSSIMPGKVNPVLAEMLNMICFHALGCDAAIVAAAQAGQLQLNVMMPVIAYNLIQEIQALAGGMNAFAEKCVSGIRADRERCGAYAERSSSVVTALNPHIGYHRAAQLAYEALEKDVTVRQLVVEKNIMPEDQLDTVLDLRRMTEPPQPD